MAGDGEEGEDRPMVWPKETLEEKVLGEQRVFRGQLETMMAQMQELVKNSQGTNGKVVRRCRRRRLHRRQLRRRRRRRRSGWMEEDQRKIKHRHARLVR